MSPILAGDCQSCRHRLEHHDGKGCLECEGCELSAFAGSPAIAVADAALLAWLGVMLAAIAGAWFGVW